MKKKARRTNVGPAAPLQHAIDQLQRFDASDQALAIEVIESIATAPPRRVPQTGDPQ